MRRRQKREREWMYERTNERRLKCNGACWWVEMNCATHINRCYAYNSNISYHTKCVRVYENDSSIILLYVDFMSKFWMKWSNNNKSISQLVFDLLPNFVNCTHTHTLFVCLCFSTRAIWVKFERCMC